MMPPSDLTDLLERAAARPQTPGKVDDVWRRGQARRRRKRAGIATGTALAVVGVVAAATTLWPQPRAPFIEDGSPAPGVSPAVSVERTLVVGSDRGTAQVIMEFDGRLPGRHVRYVENIASPEAGDQISYTIQDAASVHVCESVHSFPPPAEGTVDLLIPADWFADGESAHTSPLETIANPAKFVVCGPHEGYFQYSIWGPASADAADVDVTVDRDGRRLTVQIDSEPESTATQRPTIDQDDAEAAESVVAAFLDDLRTGDLAAAAARWTGYPGQMGPDAPLEDKTMRVERLLGDPDITRILEGDTKTFVTASWAWTTANPVVTVLAPRDGDDPPAAVAFLTGYSQSADGESMRIQRLPHSPDSTQPDVDGSFVEAGQQIVIPGVPIEGGARAYINDREISVDVDYENLTMTITLPDDAEGDVAITVSTATPELPEALAFALTVGSP